MKKIYKSLLILMFAIAFTSTSFAGQVLVKTMPLGEDGITGTGIVRVVVKLTDAAIGPDCGVILHQDAVFTGWNQGMSIVMLDLETASPQLAGYNGTTWDRAENVKSFERNQRVALWLTIDAANNVHALSAQIEGEDAVTTVFEGYQSRSINKGEPSDSANYCSVFINDKNGQTADAVVVLKDAEIVSSIEAFDFSTVGTAIASNELAPSISVYPTLAQDILNISSAVEISSVKIFSLLGQEVFSGSDSKVIPVSALNSGTYIVEVKTVNNLVSRQKFIKK